MAIKPSHHRGRVVNPKETQDGGKRVISLRSHPNGDPSGNLDGKEQVTGPNS